MICQESAENWGGMDPWRHIKGPLKQTYMYVSIVIMNFDIDVLKLREFKIRLDYTGSVFRVRNCVYSSKSEEPK